MKTNNLTKIKKLCAGILLLSAPHVWGGGINDSLAIRARARSLGVPEKLFNEFYELEKNEMAAMRTMAPPTGGSTYTSPCSSPTPYTDNQLVNLVAHTNCTNADFEQGNLSGWVCRYGYFDDCNVNNQHCQNMIGSGAPVPGRHSIMTQPVLDPYGSFPVIAPGGNYSVRLGNSKIGAEAEELIYKVTVDTSRPFFVYRYAAVLEDPGHPTAAQPFFEVAAYEITNSGLLVDCSQFKVIPTVAPVPTIKDIKQFSSGYYAGVYSYYGGVYKEWSTNVIDLSHLSQGAEVAIIFKSSDCAYGGHFGYAYIDAYCANELIEADGELCSGSDVEFATLEGNESVESYDWKVYAGACTTCTTTPLASCTTSTFPYTFTSPGQYTVECTYSYTNFCKMGSCTFSLHKTVTIEDCEVEVVRCEQCISSFAPLPGKKYVISAWVREEFDKANPPVTFTKPYIRISFPGTTFEYDLIKASGPIIDGWQKIDYEFIIPGAASKIQVDLKNSDNENSVNFDDVRIYPVDGVMKSFVFDPLSNRLMAELDENNFATFYEYNEEGALIRVKKETEKGIKTLSETQQNIKRTPQ